MGKIYMFAVNLTLIQCDVISHTRLTSFLMYSNGPGGTWLSLKAYQGTEGGKRAYKFVDG